MCCSGCGVALLHPAGCIRAELRCACMLPRCAEHTCCAAAAAVFASFGFVYCAVSSVVLSRPGQMGSKFSLHASCSCMQLHASPTAKSTDRHARSCIHQAHVTKTVLCGLGLHCACCCWFRVERALQETDIARRRLSSWTCDRFIRTWSMLLFESWGLWGTCGSFFTHAGQLEGRLQG
jgi:hypothetical protein